MSTPVPTTPTASPPPTPASKVSVGFLKTPTARLVAHSVIAFLAAFLPLLVATSQPLTKDFIIGAVVAAIRAVLGLTTSTNPSVGKNVV